MKGIRWIVRLGIALAAVAVVIVALPDIPAQRAQQSAACQVDAEKYSDQLHLANASGLTLLTVEATHTQSCMEAHGYFLNLKGRCERYIRMPENADGQMMAIVTSNRQTAAICYEPGDWRLRKLNEIEMWVRQL